MATIAESRSERKQFASPRPWIVGLCCMYFAGPALFMLSLWVGEKGGDLLGLALVLLPLTALANLAIACRITWGFLRGERRLASMAFVWLLLSISPLEAWLYQEYFVDLLAWMRA